MSLAARGLHLCDRQMLSEVAEGANNDLLVQNTNVSRLLFFICSCPPREAFESSNEAPRGAL